MIIDLSRRNLLECPKVEQWFNENLSTNKLSLNKLNLLIDNKKINFRNDIFYDIDLLDFDWKKVTISIKIIGGRYSLFVLSIGFQALLIYRMKKLLIILDISRGLL